jgi:hypothetical protein
LNIRSSEITQIAPVLQVNGPEIVTWPIDNYALPVIEADDEDFLWVVIEVRQRIVKKDVPELSIKDVNDNEVGSLYACIDASKYIRPGIPIISFVGGVKIPIESLPDKKAAKLLYNLAFAKWTTRNMLLIFKGKYRSVEDLYLDGPNVHVLLHLDQRSSHVRSPNIRGSRQNIDRNNIQNSRKRSGRTSSRERTR